MPEYKIFETNTTFYLRIFQSKKQYEPFSSSARSAYITKIPGILTDAILSPGDPEKSKKAQKIRYSNRRRTFIALSLYIRIVSVFFRSFTIKRKFINYYFFKYLHIKTYSEKLQIFKNCIHIIMVSSNRKSISLSIQFAKYIVIRN